MKASLTIAGNGYIRIELTPETDAEKDILKRVGEERWLTSYYDNSVYQLEYQHLVITKKSVIPASDLCEHGYNGLCPTCAATQTPQMSEGV